jgi:outer membrane protein assembly factor BamB
MRNFFAFLSLFCFLTACDKEKEYDKSKAVSAFISVDPIKLDVALENVGIILPKQEKNSFWSGSAAAQNQLIENFEKNFTQKDAGFFKKTREISLVKSSPAWLFYAGNLSDHFVFSPIIKDKKVFILDTSGALIAKNLESGKKIWSIRVFERKILKNYRSPRIGYGSGKIIATAGINKIAAINEENGEIIWSKEISSIPVSNPVCDEKSVYITTNDNKLYAFDLNSGELNWVQSGINRPTTIFGAADPVLYKDFVVVSYSSGEIYAVKRSNGEALWSQDLNFNKAVNSDFYLNDIDATPLVKNGVVYAIGNGGLMMAIDVKKGNYIWRKRIAGIVDFWGAGEFLFVINNDDKLLAVSKKTGGIKWISQLPDFKDAKKLNTKFIYSGIVMAGGKLVISRADGNVMIVSPFDGKIEKTISLGKRISHSPIVIDGKIYLHTIGRWTIDLIEIQ